MEKTTNQLTNIEIPIANRVKQVCLEYMGFEPNNISCTFLRSRDLVITLERQRSATEHFLANQGQPALSKEIGASVNQAFQERLAFILIKEFDLPVHDISTLKPARRDKFSLMILMNW